jgi:hypothetical protein
MFSSLLEIGRSASYDEKKRQHVSFMNTNEHPRENLIRKYFPLVYLYVFEYIYIYLYLRKTVFCFNNNHREQTEKKLVNFCEYVEKYKKHCISVVVATQQEKKKKKIICIRRETSLWYTHTHVKKQSWNKDFPLHDNIRSA